MSSAFTPAGEVTAILNQISTPTLAAMTRGDVDLLALFAHALAARGVDLGGNWVGFSRAGEIAAQRVDAVREAQKPRTEIPTEMLTTLTKALGFRSTTARGKDAFDTQGVHINDVVKVLNEAYVG